MTIHSPHPDTHSHGLHDDCERCAEHAQHPILSLDRENLARIVRLAVNPDRHSAALSHLDLVAATRVLNLLEQVGELAQADPYALCAFLSRYGVLLAPIGATAAAS